MEKIKITANSRMKEIKMNNEMDDNTFSRVSSTSDYAAAKNAIYSLAMAVAKNEDEQKAFSKAFREIEREDWHEPHKEIILQMLSVVFNGLAYGNWPWNR